MEKFLKDDVRNPPGISPQVQVLFFMDTRPAPAVGSRGCRAATAASSKHSLNKSKAQEEIFSFQNLLIPRIAQRFPGFVHSCPGTGKAQHKPGDIKWVRNQRLSRPRRLFLFYSWAIKSKQLWSLPLLLCSLGLIFLSLEENYFQGIQTPAVKAGRLCQERS